jgi:hypothetical protein
VRYRLLRMPGGVVGLAEELGGPVHAGYRLELLCDHFADPTPLVERLPIESRAAIAQPYLKLDARYGLTIASDVVAGRLEEGDQEDEFGLPEEGPRVIVDGQSMSWAEFGELLGSYVGWSFELRLGGDPPSRGRGDTPARITVREPTAAELRAAVALRMAPTSWTARTTRRQRSGPNATSVEVAAQGSVRLTQQRANRSVSLLGEVAVCGRHCPKVRLSWRDGRALIRRRHNVTAPRAILGTRTGCPTRPFTR